jgi:cerevisin
MKGIIGLSLLPLLAAASPVVVDSIHNGVAPVLSASNVEEVPDSYIIVFKNHVDDASAAAHHSWVQDLHVQSGNGRTELRKRSQFPWRNDIFGGLKHTFNVAGTLLGYSGHFDEEVIEQIRRHPDVSDGLITETIPKRVTNRTPGCVYREGLNCSHYGR